MVTITATRRALHARKQKRETKHHERLLHGLLAGDFSCLILPFERRKEEDYS
jgi:hypothetical protein